ncbi:hypothetical protein SUGI_0246220 [Cryptomeria japonica]|nr:hypothetical protein SUGI_0246220 [Cryptomeria japonica]
MDNTSTLDLENRSSFRSNLLREDPNGYSSRVYYRSNVNEDGGVPFEWETQPGKPKTDNVEDPFNVLPLNPPPSFGSSQGKTKLRSVKKKTGKKSKKIRGSCMGCYPFSFKMIQYLVKV